MEYVILPSQRYLIQREQVWIDCDPMTVALRCTTVDHRSTLILTILHSGLSVGRLRTSINFSVFQPPASSKSVKTCVHRTAPSAS